MPIAVNNLIGQTFNDLYPQRPVWGIASNGTVVNNSPVVSMFNENNPYVAMNVEFAGNSKTRARNFIDEMAQSSYAFNGYTTAPTTNAWTPTSGYYGIGVSTQTGCLNNFDGADNGSYGYYQAVNSAADKLAVRSGIIVGESNWRQCYDLVLDSTGYLYKEEIGGGLNAAINNNKPFINLNTDLGAAFNNAGATNWGLGQISHNRNTGRLLVAQPLAGAIGAINFRLHFFDLQMKIGRTTKIADIKAAMVAASQAGSNRYRYADVTFTSVQAHYAAIGTYDMADSQFVLCDNDEVWMFKSSDSAVTGSGYSNVLFRVNLTGGTYLTGTYAASLLINFTGTTQYGAATGPIYGARHMNSDDNSVIALYQQAYYYNGGYNIAFVSTKNAGAASYNSMSNVAATTYTIAPSGGAGFALCNSGANNDTAGPAIALINNDVLAGTTIVPTFTNCLWPAYNSSTCYGGNLVFKVQPTTEWK